MKSIHVVLVDLSLRMFLFFSEFIWRSLICERVQTQLRFQKRNKFKRKAETDREQLEREIREDSEELLQTNMDFDWFRVGGGEPVLVASLGTLEGPASFAPATSPEMFSGSLDSVCFNRSNEHDFVKMRLGGQDVLVWKPDSIIDDQSLQELDLEQGFKGMQEEVRNLEHCKTGRIITQSELDDMKKAVPNLRLIQSRWVAAYKSSERVEPGLLQKTSIVAPQLDLWDLVVQLLRSKVFMWCLQWQRHGRCFCVHWT